jgi:hypothetical protein
MNEPTVARMPGSETAWIGWPRPAARPDVASTPRELGRSTPELPGVDRVDVGRGGLENRAYARFSFNEKTGSVSIRIVDPRTDEVIREIPPERVALIAEELQALARRNAPGGRLADGGPLGAPSIPAGGVDQYV